MRDQALDLVAAALEVATGDEPLTDPDELPESFEELAALAATLREVSQAARRLTREVEAKLGAVIGPGERVRYGDHLLSWSHASKWQPQQGAERFVMSVARQRPDAILDLFNLNAMRKTGVERAARKLGLNPDTVVSTVLAKVWDAEPGVVWKHEPATKENRDDRHDD